MVTYGLTTQIGPGYPELLERDYFKMLRFNDPAKVCFDCRVNFSLCLDCKAEKIKTL